MKINKGLYVSCSGLEKEVTGMYFDQSSFTKDSFQPLSTSSLTHIVKPSTEVVSLPRAGISSAVLEDEAWTFENSSIDDLNYIFSNCQLFRPPSSNYIEETDEETNLWSPTYSEVTKLICKRRRLLSRERTRRLRLGIHTKVSPRVMGTAAMQSLPSISASIARPRKMSSLAELDQAFTAQRERGPHPPRKQWPTALKGKQNQRQRFLRPLHCDLD